MILAEAGYLFMGFILLISGIQGRQDSICALKGSSVYLPCSAKHPTLGMKWYTGHWNDDKYVLNELSADGDRVTYNKSQTSNFTLTINNLTESDANDYCCKKNTGKPENGKQSAIQLRVADLQVKVLPTTEGQAVTLMCRTSCALTESPESYIWYKNRESLYQDWSPWYQELVSSEEAVRYSCAVKGYEDLRAPEVSVDSVTSSCFTVTYAKGRMCSYHQKPEDEPCSITFPREVHVHKSRAARSGHVRLSCNTNCPLTAFVWYKSRLLLREYNKPHLEVPSTSTESFSCAVKGSEDLRSAEICTGGNNCWSVNYVSRRICTLEGSSVDISSEYSHFNYQPNVKLWHKIKRNSEEEGQLIKSKGRVEYHENMRDRHNLRITNLKEDDSAEYKFKLQKDKERWEPGVTLVVTGLKVKFAPSAEVTEDQRVTLTCSTSCPLTSNTNYIWFFNSRPLTLTENQNKHLVLHPVSSQHAGNYSCAVKTQTDIRSSEETLMVHDKPGKGTSLLATGVCAPLLVIILLTVFLWIRKKRSSSQSRGNEISNNPKQLNPGPLYEDILPQLQEQDEHLYWGLRFSNENTDALYSSVKPVPHK